MSTRQESPQGRTGGAAYLTTDILQGSAIRDWLYGCHSSLDFFVFIHCKHLKESPVFPCLKVFGKAHISSKGEGARNKLKIRT